VALKDGNTKAAVVIDVGCATHGSDQSIGHLLDEFFPDVLIGYDPAAHRQTWTEKGTLISVFPMVAWTFDGQVRFQLARTSGHVTEDTAAPLFDCVDLAKVITKAQQRHGQPVVLKMDAEGAEYVLLPYLLEKGVTVDLAWIEWHPNLGDPHGIVRADIERRWQGDIISWHW
jgi:hypothetical protein